MKQIYWWEWCNEATWSDPWKRHGVNTGSPELTVSSCTRWLCRSWSCWGRCNPRPSLPVTHGLNKNECGQKKKKKDFSYISPLPANDTYWWWTISYRFKFLLAPRATYSTQHLSHPAGNFKSILDTSTADRISCGDSGTDGSTVMIMWFELVAGL